MKQNGGILSAADLRDYKVKLHEPVRTTYRGYEIAGFPPPSSGGVHAGEILNILENFDLKAMGHDSSQFIHAVAESMKLAFADRPDWLGASDFGRIPRVLISKGYSARLARRINVDRPTHVQGH